MVGGGAAVFAVAVMCPCSSSVPADLHAVMRRTRYPVRCCDEVASAMDCRPARRLGGPPVVVLASTKRLPALLP